MFALRGRMLSLLILRFVAGDATAHHETRLIGGRSVRLDDCPAIPAKEPPKPRACLSSRGDQVMKPLALRVQMAVELRLTRRVVQIDAGHRSALACEANAVSSIRGVQGPTRANLLLDPLGFRRHEPMVAQAPRERAPSVACPVVSVILVARKPRA